MSDLNSLLLLIDQNYSPDYWADIERFHVATLLGKLSLSEWQELETCWTSLSSQGKINLVEACNVLDSSHCIPLLEKMLRSENAQLGAAIAHALLEMGYTWNSEVTLRKDLERHHAQTSGYEQQRIAELMARLPS
jgi:hypothetical protein